MPDWSAIARARGIDLSDVELERISKPLDGLERVFRPLTQSLTPDLDPVTAFDPAEEAE